MPTREAELDRSRDRDDEYQRVVDYLRTTPVGEWVVGTKVSKDTGIQTETLGRLAAKRSLSIQSVHRLYGSNGSENKWYRLHPTLETRPQVDREVEREKRNEERAAKLARMMCLR